jgi:hypothetical protein
MEYICYGIYMLELLKIKVTDIKQVINFFLKIYMLIYTNISTYIC